MKNEKEKKYQGLRTTIICQSLIVQLQLLKSQYLFALNSPLI